MTKARAVFIAASVLACLLAVSGKTLLGSGVNNFGDDHKTNLQVSLPLNSMDGLDVQGISELGAEPVKMQADVASYRGRRAVRIVDIESPGAKIGEQVLAILKTSDFKDGTIEAEVAGVPRQGAKPSTRGFVGIAFRVQDRGSKYEAFYLRMTNGRADDQLQRNHSAQYVSHPDFPWERLREENPGIYESYVDLEAGGWTRIKIVVSGIKAQLYVNGASSALPNRERSEVGRNSWPVALWTGSDTEAYFSNSDDSVGAKTWRDQKLLAGFYCLLLQSAQAI